MERRTSRVRVPRSSWPDSPYGTRYAGRPGRARFLAQVGQKSTYTIPPTLSEKNAAFCGGLAADPAPHAHGSPATALPRMLGRKSLRSKRWQRPRSQQGAEAAPLAAHAAVRRGRGRAVRGAVCREASATECSSAPHLPHSVPCSRPRASGLTEVRPGKTRVSSDPQNLKRAPRVVAMLSLA